MSSILDALREKESTLSGLREKESRRQGREEQLLKQLQTQFKLSTVEEAQVLQTQLQSQLDECSGKLQALDTEMAGIIAAAQAPKEVKACG